MVPVEKNSDRELPVPSIWRPAFHAIVAKIANDEYETMGNIPNVRPLAYSVSKSVRESLEAYGATVTELSPQTWQTSICSWQEIEWLVVVDLFTLEEGASDLVLHAAVVESGEGYRIEVRSIHVP